MASPSYTTDLTDIDTNLAESVTGYVAYGGGPAGLGAGADFAMQGTNCVDKQITGAERGILYDKGSGITMGADDHTFIWHFTATPGVTDSLVNRGAVVNIGSSALNFCKYHVEGNDTFGAGGRVGKCYAIDQSVDTANTGSVPYRTRVGTPSGTLQFFGSGLSTTATVKSANMGLDATRYGTGAYITAGDATTPATFAGFATESDAIAKRWGILTELGGTFELQGHFVIGQASSGSPAATLAYFEDSEVTINLVDTVHSATDFTRFIFDHASTEVYWTNITIKALGTNNRGYLEVLDAAIAFEMSGGSFTGFGTTTLLGGCSADRTAWRGCDQVSITGAATLDFCVFDNSDGTSAVSAATLNNITDCSFTAGTNAKHAVDLGTISTTQSMNWNNSDSGYTAGSPFGDETILVSVDSGKTLTINVGSGYTTPSVYNTGLGTVSVVAGQVTTKVIVKHSDGTALTTEDANVLLEAAAGGPLAVGTDIIKGFTDTAGEIQDIRSLASNQPVTGWVRKGSASPYYKEYSLQGTIDNANGLTLIAQLVDDE